MPIDKAPVAKKKAPVPKAVKVADVVEEGDPPEPEPTKRAPRTVRKEPDLGRCFDGIRMKSDLTAKEAPLISDVAEIAGVGMLRVTHALQIRHFPLGESRPGVYWKNLASPGHTVHLSHLQTGVPVTWVTQNPLGFLPGAN